MNLNNGEEEEEEVDLFFTQRCLELAKLLRTDQTDAFLHLYDSLPSEWTGSRLETAKETIRQYQELDENDFHSLYQRAFDNMSKQSLKKSTDDTNKRFQSIPNNRTSTAVDSFVQLNLKPDLNIRLEDYKKAIDTMPVTKSSSTNNRSVNLTKKHYRSHQDASFDYFSPQHDEQQQQHSRSSSSSSSSSTTTTTTAKNPQKDLHKHGKLIETHDFDSHGSSITTKSSSENSESIRTGSGSDSDEEEKKPLLANTKSKLYSNETKRNYDDTLTLVLNQTSDHQTSHHDLKLTLPEQNSYELVKSPTPTDPPSLPQLPRFKQPASDDPNGLNHSNNDLLSYTTQRSPLNNPSISSSSHQTRTSERHEQYNTNHSNSSRKSATRTAKKRKQLQQQEIIRTELIPGHRGDLDVDELVMFIDGQTSNKQRQNSSSARTIETNSNQTNTSTAKRKSRKSSKILQDNETKQFNHDDNDDDDKNNNNNNNNIHFLDEHHQTHSLDEQIQLEINPDDNDDESHLNTTNGEISLPEWHNTSSNNDEFDSLSLSSLTLNNSNSEIISEPFVTVTHRRRSIKERRQETNNNSNSSTNRTARLSEKRRFQPIQQNGINRSTISNAKSSIETTREEELKQPIDINSPPPPPAVPAETPTDIPPVPPPPPPPPLPSSSSSIPEQTSPRLSSHSSSSSLSSLLKRQSKVAPPVVFLNKSIDVELNDVSFGFDMETSTTDKPSTPTPTSPPSPSPPPSTSEPSVDKDNQHSSSAKRSYPQRNIRSQPFHSSNTDTRPHQQQRNHPSQSSSSYVDPYLLLQYNQQRYQQLAYMNYFRSQYLPSQSPYVLIPTIPSSSSFETNSDDKDSPNEHVHEPLFVYTTLPGQTQPMYYPTNKKSFQSMYPSQYFYPTTHPAYFQPISTSSLIDNKSQQDDTDHDDLLDDDDIEHDYDKSSTRFFPRTQQSSSSAHIMSNALQLVYSQEKLNAQTDRFNLDQLTAYLAMKWTETVDHYEQGDDEILLTSE